MRPVTTALVLIMATCVGCATWPGTPTGRPGASPRQKSVAPRNHHRSGAAVTPTSGDDKTGPVSLLVINGETIEADRILRGVYDDLLERSRTLPPDGYRAYLMRRATAAIRDKIADVLLYQQGSLRLSSEEKTVVDKIVDGEIRRMIATEYGGVQRRYERQLETDGQTLEDVRTAIRREIIVARYLELNVKPKVPEPTRDELLAMFEAGADQWRHPPRRSMSLIEVHLREHLPEDVAHPTPEQLATARAHARQETEEARDKLREGTPFAEVARRYSDGLHAEEGGVWGWVTLEGVRERFQPAVETLCRLEAGAVSDIVATDESFFLVRCDESDPGLEPDFQTVQPQLRDRGFRAAYNSLIAELVQDLREKASVQPENLDRFLLAVLETAPLPGGVDPRR